MLDRNFVGWKKMKLVFANSIHISHYNFKYCHELSNLKYPGNIFSNSSIHNIDKVQLSLEFITITALTEIEFLHRT